MITAIRAPKLYQATLPMTTRRLKPLTPLPRPEPPRPFPDDRQTANLAHNLRRHIEEAFLLGYWECLACHCRCEWIEGEQGQPATSNCCHSPRVLWHPPIDQLVGKEGV
jgi:hypothetical protein